MDNQAHPATYLRPEWIKIIRDHSAKAEQSGNLHPEQLKLAYQQLWFKLFVPKVYGGLEMAFPDAVRLEEGLAWADGSMGWTITLCSGAGWFGGFLDKDLARDIFAVPEVCLGGSGAPTGTAVTTENGYQISGKWKYATGAVHTTHFTANCIIESSKENECEKLLILPFIFDQKDVTISNDWDVTGLVATGSHSFEVNQLNVSKNQSFIIDSEHATADHSIYRYPFLQFAEATLAVNISGMACHFIDLCEGIFTGRISDKKLKDYQQETLNGTLASAKEIIAEKRAGFYATVDKSWRSLERNNSISELLLAEVSEVSRELAKSSLKQVNELYPLCGINAVSPSSEINRVWRDLHTASQHTLLSMPY